MSCPTSLVQAPVDLVWSLLTDPAGWGEFYDLRILSLQPPGPATVGQTVFAESGPRALHLKVEFRFFEIDPVKHRHGFDVRMPLGISVSENMTCFPTGPASCRVTYNCDFDFPRGWAGWLTRLALWRELDRGPTDSLARLQRAAERRYRAGETSDGKPRASGLPDVSSAAATPAQPGPAAAPG